MSELAPLEIQLLNRVESAQDISVKTKDYQEEEDRNKAN